MFTDNYSPNNDGGALFIFAGSPSVDIHDCTFIGNRSDTDGGALYIASGPVPLPPAAPGPNPLLTDCIFADNVADDNGNGTGDGGGVFVSTLGGGQVALDLT